jgi:simple sugar transport system substrate-binding protein
MIKFCKRFFSLMALSSSVLFFLITNTFAGNPTKVGFVYLHTKEDFGWTMAHEMGRQMVVKHFGKDVKVTEVNNVPEGPDSTRVIRELAKQGNEIIFTTSFGYMEPTHKVAKEFPNVKFEHITGYKRSKNVATGNIRFYEGRYIQGVVAGLMTKTNKIGYIASFPISEVVMGINAFALGLRSVNKDASISVIWVNTWKDSVKEADAAKVHIAEGSDVLTQHTDTPAMLQIAEKSGVLGFGQATDMATFAPNAQLFSSINNWGPYYIKKIEQLRSGKWNTGDGPKHWAGDEWGGLKSEMLTISKFQNMPNDVAQKAQKVHDEIKSGKLKIFSGPLINNKGKEIIPAGKSLDDAALWGMNYYLMGVNGKIPG